jgi:hypothetical protein
MPTTAPATTAVTRFTGFSITTNPDQNPSNLPLKS